MNLHTAPVGRAFWHYTFPSVAALMVSGTYQIVDGIFVGHFIGGEGLAAISLAWPFVGVLLAAGMMVGIGTGAHMSMMLGARNPEAARSYLAQSFFLMLLLSLLLGSLLWAGSSAFLRAQGATGEALIFGQSYLDWLLKGTPIILASIVLPLLVRNAGAPRLATLAMGIGAISNIFLDALFIGLLGYGLEGAALATLLGELTSVLLCLGYLFSRRSQLPIKRRQVRWEGDKALRLLKTGFSSMLMYLYLSFSIVLHNFLLLRYGSSVHVAAYSIAGYILTFYYLFAEGIAGGVQPITSFYKGAEKSAHIKSAYKLGIGIVIGAGLAFVMAINLSPQFFAQFFINPTETELLQVTEQALRLFLFAMFLDGFLVVTSTWFQSLGLARPATLITLGNMGIQIPFLLILPPWLGINGIWLALPLSNILLTLAVLLLVAYQWRQLSKIRRLPLSILTKCAL